MAKSKTRPSVSDINGVDMPYRINEIPDSTVRLFLSLNKYPLSYKNDLEEVATALSLRYGYPIYKELTPSSPWQRVYCKKVLVAGICLIKEKDKLEAEA